MCASQYSTRDDVFGSDFLLSGSFDNQNDQNVNEDLESGGKSSSRDSDEEFSDFDEGAQGEPIRAQHLMIDFNHIPDVDNPIVEKKCSDFWEYVNSRDDILKLIVSPDPTFEEVVPEASATSPIKVVSVTSDRPANVIKASPTALSTLEINQGKGYLKEAFDPMTCASSACSLGSREYIEQQIDKVTQWKPIMCPCDCKLAIAFKHENATKDKERDIKDFEYLYQHMEEWDKDHPKSMDPPVGPPSAISAKFQRHEVYPGILSSETLPKP